MSLSSSVAALAALAVFLLAAIATTTTNAVSAPTRFHGKASLTGNDYMFVSMDTNAITDEVKVVLEGPAKLYFGIGFGSYHMSDTWCFVVSGDGIVQEYVLGKHEAGAAVDSTFTIMSNVVVAGIRTVTLVRSNSKVISDVYYDFVGEYHPIVYAWGVNADYKYHGDNYGKALLSLQQNGDDIETETAHENAWPAGIITYFASHSRHFSWAKSLLVTVVAVCVMVCVLLVYAFCWKWKICGCAHQHGQRKNQRAENTPLLQALV